MERFFAALTEKQIRRIGFRSTQQLETSIRQYLDHHNAQPKPFLWTKSADDILNSLAKYCERTNGLRTLERLASKYILGWLLVRQAERDYVRTGCDSNVLFVVEQISHRRGMRWLAGLEPPK